MGKTTIYTFKSKSLFSVAIIVLFLGYFSVGTLQSQSRREQSRALKKEVFKLHQGDLETESLPFLERYLEMNPTEIYYKLLYAKALLYRKDLPVPRIDENIESRTEKSIAIKQNYNKATELFSENVLHLQKVKPRDPNLGKWYYLWAFSEWFSDNKEKAILLFRKAVKLDYRLTEAYYNIAALYESTNQMRDADIFWKKYEKAEKELEEEE